MINDWLIPFLKKVKCESFIDVGCGYGGLAGMVKAFFPQAKVVGVDISEGYIRQARESYPDVEFRLADARRLRLKNINVAHTHGFLIHVTHRNIKKTIRRIARIAKYCLFTESQGKEQPGTLVYDPKDYWNKRWGKKKPDLIDLNTQYYYCHDYMKIFKELGLKVKIIKDWKDNKKTRLYLCQK